MKKQIALIIVSMLASLSASAQNVNENYCNNEMCRNYSTPICEMGEGIIQPDLECILGICPETPTLPEKPVVPDVPIIPEAPETPEAPDAPELPDSPEFPELPETPGIPEQDKPETEAPETNVPEVETPETSFAREVFELVNAERVKRGLSVLTYDTVLERAANIRAVETKTLFSHTRPDGRSCFTALDEVGYSYRTAGENIAYGQRSASEVMNAWMNSEGHRANILGNYTKIGIGVYENGGVIYWSQFFAS